MGGWNPVAIVVVLLLLFFSGWEGEHTYMYTYERTNHSSILE